MATTRGLVVGKFMPLHKGHQFLIESAARQVDELTVVVYDTPVDDEANKLMPAYMRARWITDLYPNDRKATFRNITNVVIRDDIHPELKYQERDSEIYSQDYADDLAFLGPFDKVFSSEAYGEPFAKALQAKHIMVDFSRLNKPISGTEIRKSIYDNRHWIHPRVYRDLIQKVVFVGTESTGKSTLAKALAAEYDTKWVHEYGREYWEMKRKNNIPDTFEDFWHTGKTQYDREQAAMMEANRYLFCDTNAWTTYQWSKLYYDTADEKLKNLAYDTRNDYIWFFCGNEFGWQDDGSRELKENSKEFQIQLQVDLMRWGVDLHFLRGSVEKRTAFVKGVLESSSNIKMYL